MKKTVFMCVLAPLLGACASIEVDDCRGWAKTVTVNYGDGGITVTPRRKVKQQKPFVIKLSPDSNDWKDNKVKVTGKSKDPAACKNENWLDREHSYNDMKRFKYCAPEIPEAVPADVDCKYEYSVEVKGAAGVTVLFVDPRVDVTH